MSNFSFGADPEFVLTNNDNLVSAIGILPSKNHAITSDGHAFYYDNVLAEIAIKPGLTKKEVIFNIRESFQQLKNILNPVQFEARAAQNYPLKQLLHEDAIIAGCNPEWNVYTLKSVIAPEDIIKKTPFRTAGGHIHLGTNEVLYDPFEVLNVIRMLDLFVGVPSVFLDTDETSRERRKIYGHAGSYRVAEYGVEYRALGNFWLSSPEHVSLIYDLCEFTINFVEEGHHAKFWSMDENLLDEDSSKAFSCAGYDLDALLQCINNCDKKQGDKFMTFISNYLPNNLREEIEKLAQNKLPNLYNAWCLV